ncbi:EF-hand domain-containing protein [Paraburkholderia caribensis]|uniref:EF-hand domain-containing protein n=1 Tax=Paraburkholderia caribensis TaxID=75105 RepID=UPI001F275DD4|nr:EF-hand domain-containing protein [Paraburkholderia caribensis]
MSVSGISNQRAIPQPQSRTPSAFSNDGTFAAPSTSPASPQTPATGSSTQVTFSPDAQALAELKANGVSVATVSLVGLNTTRAPGESDVDYIQQLDAAIKSRLPFAQVTIEGRDGNVNGYIAQSDFETVLAGFGVDKSDANHLFSALDEDHNGSVSNAEWLSAVRDMASTPGDPTAQSLLKPMDSNGDGTVSTTEFTQFESTMIAAEKLAS